jgi:hypothetical protein
VVAEVLHFVQDDKFVLGTSSFWMTKFRDGWRKGVLAMSVLIGDLMASVDERYESGGDWEGPRKKSLRTGGKLPPKRMGELSELDFLRKAMGMGMIVSKPWGDSYRYDFVCDAGGRLWRAQVRSTEDRFGARGYAVHASAYVGRKIVGLTAKDIDVLIGYIVSRDIWYVVPVKAFVPRKNLWFYPDGSKKGAMFEKWREAWWVMMGKKWRVKK